MQFRQFQDDRQLVKKWLVVGMLKKVFSGQPDNVIRPIRKILVHHHNEFPLNRIIEEFKGGAKSFTINDDKLYNLLTYKYGQKQTFSILALLYPSLDFRNIFHMDHIFAQNLLKKKNLVNSGISQDAIDFTIELIDTIANLQLLEGIPNIEKSDQSFERWVNKVYKDVQSKNDYFNKHFIPQVELSISNFREFIEQRKELLFQALKSKV